jgi:hypothetical protein
MIHPVVIRHDGGGAGAKPVRASLEFAIGYLSQRVTQRKL